MHVEQDDLWLCDECTQAAVNDDYTGLDYHYQQPQADRREAAIRAGLTRLGPNLVLNSDGDEGREEYMTHDCDCCGSGLAGARERFAILGEEARA